jgi:hypothetical protein
MTITIVAVTLKTTNPFGVPFSDQSSHVSGDSLNQCYLLAPNTEPLLPAATAEIATSCRVYHPGGMDGHAGRARLVLAPSPPIPRQPSSVPAHQGRGVEGD